MNTDTCLVYFWKHWFKLARINLFMFVTLGMYMFGSICLHSPRLMFMFAFNWRSLNYVREAIVYGVNERA